MNTTQPERGIPMFSALTPFDLDKQIDFSRKTFGPHPSTARVLDHMAKELEEIRAKPDDLSEWIDMMILAVDGAQRNCGATGQQIIDAYKAKLEKNYARTWPRWQDVPEDKAIEHVKS